MDAQAKAQTLPAPAGLDVYEVFVQPHRGDPHVHAGSVLAGTPDLALVFAKENFGRRPGCVNLWVVPRSAITATAYDDEDLFQPATDRSYRLNEGYRHTVQKWRDFRVRVERRASDPFGYEDHVLSGAGEGESR